MNVHSRTAVTLFTTFILVLTVCSSFEFAGYCRKMCMWGRGGNLCRCNAVHFAGKRTNPASLSDTWGEDIEVLPDEEILTPSQALEGEGEGGDPVDSVPGVEIEVLGDPPLTTKYTELKPLLRRLVVYIIYN